MSKVFSLVTSLLVSDRAVLSALWRKGFAQSVLGLRICSVCGCYGSQASWRGFLCRSSRFWVNSMACLVAVIIGITG